mgnify:CR=1 FL=1
MVIVFTFRMSTALASTPRIKMVNHGNNIGLIHRKFGPLNAVAAIRAKKQLESLLVHTFAPKETGSSTSFPSARDVIN